MKTQSFLTVIFKQAIKLFFMAILLVLWGICKFINTVFGKFQIGIEGYMNQK